MEKYVAVVVYGYLLVRWLWLSRKAKRKMAEAEELDRKRRSEIHALKEEVSKLKRAS